MSIQLKAIGYETYLDVVKNQMIYFHYHQKCQDITDSTGDIELDLQNQVKTLYLSETNENCVNSIKINWI